MKPALLRDKLRAAPAPAPTDQYLILSGGASFRRARGFNRSRALGAVCIKLTSAVNGGVVGLGAAAVQLPRAAPMIGSNLSPGLEPCFDAPT
jgi:hypothetical protein